MLGQVRRLLLKVPCIRKAVSDCKRREQKRKDDVLFAKCIILSGTIREAREPRVVKGYIDSTNWGGVRL